MHSPQTFSNAKCAQSYKPGHVLLNQFPSFLDKSAEILLLFLKLQIFKRSPQINESDDFHLVIFMSRAIIQG
jgi:hypothetical protein